MIREELLDLVNEKVDTTKFKSLSQKTINEELDDLLEDFGDDEAANDKIVTKLANRLKRMDGNLHKNVSDEIKRSQAGAKRREKEKKDKEETEETTEVDPKYAALEEKLNKLIQANEERSKAEAKKAVLNSVKSGLKDKFEHAKLEMNDFSLTPHCQSLRFQTRTPTSPSWCRRQREFTRPTTSARQAARLSQARALRKLTTTRTALTSMSLTT